MGLFNKLLRSLKQNKKLILVVITLVILYYLYTEHLDSQIEKFTDDKKVHVMLFHANWCGHCKEFMPVWKEFKDHIVKDKDNYSGIKTSDFESEKNPSEMKKYNIKGFPTIKIVDKKGNINDYKGERSKDGLLNELNKKYLD
jgi:thiol-disulfide isomerase/thioredoxin